MNPRDTQEQIGLFPASTPASGSPAVEATGFRGAVSGLGQAIAAVGAALLSWPERRATYARLRGLTDRELADIGLARGDIARVFEPDFHMPVRAANANEPSGRPRAA